MRAVVKRALSNYHLKMIRAKNKHCEATGLENSSKTLCIEFVLKKNVCKQLDPHWTEIRTEAKSYRNFSDFVRGNK